ncbi:104 kDa microneme/rhoptry antigen-like isoform X1 [Hylaeus volcanicus]|uniref:104 kDa microneme/rhoptry antigen-like isoform X1 n=1 Tax=Hylaeus volcanicus TaxID=313075 RepID=UPI0023B85C2C|nr:104 kDa microneme/rhoptry antigen-like isoform X1 [Hylaeus volcanicus]
MSSKRIRQEYKAHTINSRNLKMNLSHDTSIDIHSPAHKDSKSQKTIKKRLMFTDTEHKQKIYSKTHKKSPKAASPGKTSSIDTPRLLKNPKTLTPTMKSPRKSQKFSSPFKANSLQLRSNYSNNSVTTPRLSKQDTQKSFKDSSEILKKKKSATLISMKQALRKSPKIVITSPSIESIPYTNEKRQSQLKKGKSKKNSDTNRTKIKNTSASNIDVSMSMKDVYGLKEPIVVLQKLPNVNSHTPPLVKNHVKSVRNSSSNYSNTSPKIFKSVIGSPLEISKLSGKRHLKTRSTKQNIWSPSKVQEIIAVCPLKASTPKEKEQLDQVTNSNELHIEQEVQDKNGTYELDEPKTPSLRKKLQERQSAKKANSMANTAKKNVKVRFTSPLPDSRCIYGLRSQKDQVKDPNNVTIEVKLDKKLARSPVHRQSQRISNGNIPGVNYLTPTPKSYHKSKSTANVNISSPSSFNFSVKTPDSKYSSTKKVPNFAEIHKKMFAKSESVVDAKRRLERRHMALTALKVKELTRHKINSKEESVLPNEPCRGSYNRFGFKITKTDAINSIIKQRSSHLIRTKQHQKSRQILKGVRTNRRFELQMKSRNMK